MAAGAKIGAEPGYATSEAMDANVQVDAKVCHHCS
jgi:hypothetical protein